MRALWGTHRTCARTARHYKKNVARAARRGLVPECAVVVGRKERYGTEPPIYRRFLLTEDSVVISERGPIKSSEATTNAIDKKQENGKID